MKREFRQVEGEFNKMAVCHKCNRDATESRMSTYCLACVDDKPFTCDGCLTHLDPSL